MDEQTKKWNENLIAFWNSAICLSAEQKEEIRKGDRNLQELAPSEKLFHACVSLGKCHKVLDYGCGTGWGGIIAAKSGCPEVDCVDLGPNIIDAVSFFADVFEAKEYVRPQVVSVEWLKGVPAASYDGIVCSNVLDVVPTEVSESIIKELARVAKPGAEVVIGLNFYMPEEAAKARGMELLEGKYLLVDGVLRLTSLSDEEWKSLFEPCFLVERLDYFAWPGEPKETRRLFILRKPLE